MLFSDADWGAEVGGVGKGLSFPRLRAEARGLSMCPGIVQYDGGEDEDDAEDDDARDDSESTRRIEGVLYDFFSLQLSARTRARKELTPSSHSAGWKFTGMSTEKGTSSPEVEQR